MILPLSSIDVLGLYSSFKDVGSNPASVPQFSHVNMGDAHIASLMRECYENDIR